MRFFANSSRQRSITEEDEESCSSAGVDEQKPFLPTVQGDVELKAVLEDKRKCLEIPPYVAAWEGLRGIAVTMTCMSHVVPAPQKPGIFRMLGNGGVAIFFVLSGFLITGILCHKEAEKLSRNSTKMRFTFAHVPRFYTDRFARLYPALIGMVLFTSTVLIKLRQMVPDNLTRQAFAVLTYTSNLQYQGKEPTYWGNTWSLSVEEQFYIGWSLLLPILFTTTPRLRQASILALIAISFGFSYINITGAIQMPQYLVGWESATNNIWKMLIGAFVRLHPSTFKRLCRSKFAWIGLAILAASITLFSSLTADQLSAVGLGGRFLGWNVAVEPIATMCSVLIVLGSMHGNWLLETTLLRFIGRISYSLYLYSGSLLLVQGWPVGWQGFQVTCTAACAAIFSTVMIEEPFRTRYRKWMGASHH